MSRISQFRKGSSTYHCSSCNKLTRETGGSESYAGLCIDCYDDAGLENEHQDGGHDTFQADCPMCRAEKEEAEAAKPTRISHAETQAEQEARRAAYRQQMTIEHAETLRQFKLPTDTVALRIEKIKEISFLYAVDADGFEHTVYTSTSAYKVAGVREFIRGHVRDAIAFNQDLYRA